MALIISVPDTLRKSVEAASLGQNTVLYTAKGQPCYMAVIPKFTLQSIDASLGTGTHPAFIVDGVEKSYLYLGQHIGVSRNAEMLSLPGVDPINTITHDAAVALARANGTGWHAMNNIEWAAMALWCWKNGTQPRGNTAHGRSSDVTTELGVRTDGAIITGSSIGSYGRTLTGSGPTSWRHNNTPFGMADLNGNVNEWAPGARLNSGEVNIIVNNNAALNATDMAAGSAAWQAIDGATGALVAPGSAGTVKFATSGTTAYTLVRGSGSSFEGITNPSGTPVSAAALTLMKAYGLYPIAGSGLGGDAIYLNAGIEALPLRGGNWDNGALAGVFLLNLSNARANSHTSIGARPAFVV